MIIPLLQGLKLTLKQFFNKKITLKYPEQKWDLTDTRWRGRHFLEVYGDTGKPKCVACMLCATVCPAECISITAATDPEDIKYPESYVIDLGRCIFCGFCVEVCPKEAISMTKAYELSEYNRESLILDKEALLQPPLERYVNVKKKAG